jgi:hypothetical protein
VVNSTKPSLALRRCAGNKGGAPRRQRRFLYSRLGAAWIVSSIRGT